MKEKIVSKISDVVEYITNKPVESITHEDYSILVEELKKIQARESDNSFNLWIPMLLAILAMHSPVN